MNSIKQVDIDDITIGNRFRKDMGDIQSLADSIKELGLLQPIGIDMDHQLIWGKRRLQACKLLGWAQISARIVPMDQIVLGEYAENEIRKDFTVSERVAIAKKFKEQLSGRRNLTLKQNTTDPENFPDRQLKGDSRDLLADQAGFGNGKTFEQAKKVIEKAEPEVVTAMDNDKLSVNAAYHLASRDPDTQKAIATKMNEDPKATTIRNAERILKEETMQAASDDWTYSQRKRQRQCESGLTVVASQRAGDNGKPIDAALIVWAKEKGKLVEIDRGTAWGNPFEIPKDGDRAAVCRHYQDYYLPHKPSLLKKLETLKGKVLLCWCHPDPCHGHTLATKVNGHDS